MMKVLRLFIAFCSIATLSGLYACQKDSTDTIQNKSENVELINKDILHYVYQDISKLSGRIKRIIEENLPSSSNVTSVDKYINGNKIVFLVNYIFNGVSERDVYIVSEAHSNEAGLRSPPTVTKVECNGDCGENPPRNVQCIEVYSPSTDNIYCGCESNSCYMVVTTIHE